ncbi:MAG: GerMN domain-containing protein [Vulcanimicrobiaceae bacterium]
MRIARALVLVALFVAAVIIGYRLLAPKPRPATVAVYYTEPDGTTLASWNVSLGPERDPKSVAFYAAAQAVAGPPPAIEAIRFPAGTLVRGVSLAGATATVNLGGALERPTAGSFAENGEFKALVWTLTGIEPIKKVQVELDGARVPTLPGGHLELDEPLDRTSW